MKRAPLWVTLGVAIIFVAIAQSQLAAQSAGYKKAEAALRSGGVTPKSGKDSAGRSYLVTQAKVGATTLDLRVTLSRDDRIALYALKLPVIRDPKKLTRDHLLRLFIESGEYGVAYFAYSMAEKRLELREPVPTSDLGPSTHRDAVARLVNFAMLTRAIWDDPALK